ncbi:hypothetical protein EMIT0215P_10239 [Pseudomonas serboccidentalis]
MRPRQEAGRWLCIEADHPAQLRQTLTAQLADGLLGQFRYQPLQHGVVVGGLECPGAHQPLTAGLFEHVFQFRAAVGRVDVDQNHADFRRGDLRDAPLRTVRRPDTEPIPRLQTQRQQGSGMQIHRVGQLPPRIAQLLMTHHQRLTVRVLRNCLVELLPDGHRQQGFVLDATGVAAWRVCTGLIHDDPYCLYCRSEAFVARELAPARLRSSREISDPVQTDTPRTPILRPLRARAGASSLATESAAGLSELPLLSLKLTLT